MKLRVTNPPSKKTVMLNSPWPGDPAEALAQAIVKTTPEVRAALVCLVLESDSTADFALVTRATYPSLRNLPEQLREIADDIEALVKKRRAADAAADDPQP